VSEPIVIACMRCADAREHIAGARRVPCSWCSAECWYSPSSPADGVAVCIPCVLRSGATFDKVLPISAEQIAEIKAHFGAVES